MDLSEVNLSGVDLSNKDLTGTIFKYSKKVKISLIKPSNSHWLAANELQNLNITKYDLNDDLQYLATKEGFLFESKNNQVRLVLDLNNDAQYAFNDVGAESGLLSVASNNKLVYVSYTIKDFNKLESLIVDEYSLNFTKVRNILKIEGFNSAHFGGSLLFDDLGQLYLSVGDGEHVPGLENRAQNLNYFKGKVLRLDISSSKKDPEIIAYGIRNPWGVTIDSKNRMFILQCGFNDVEAVYLLNNLDSDKPVNIGWPIFEGSLKRQESSLMFNDILAPIFETRSRPGCLTAGVYLDDIESFLFADFYGVIRLLKEEDGDWHLLDEFKKDELIWGFGLDKITKKIFVAPKNLELKILLDKVKFN